MGFAVCTDSGGIFLVQIEKFKGGRSPKEGAQNLPDRNPISERPHLNKEWDEFISSLKPTDVNSWASPRKHGEKTLRE
jgi:hypothetical protein